MCYPFSFMNFSKVTCGTPLRW